MVDDGVDSNGSLSGLSVSNDELTLSTSDRNHRVHTFESSLEWFLNRLSIDHTRSLSVERHLKCSGKVDVSLSVDGLSKWVDDTSEHVVVDAN